MREQTEVQYFTNFSKRHYVITMLGKKPIQISIKMPGIVHQMCIKTLLFIFMLEVNLHFSLKNLNNTWLNLG